VFENLHPARDYRISRKNTKELFQKAVAKSPNLSITKLNPKLEQLIDKLKQLSELCLLSLRVELRVHCYHFLDQVKKTSYHLEEECNEPDLYIVELNKDLSSIEECLQPFLPKTKLRYLFEGLPRLISGTMISNIRKIKSINRNGVLKMCRNVFALQQNLTNITQVKEIHFDRVRKFYWILNMSEDEFFSNQIPENNAFSLDEYKAILELKQPNRKLPEKTLILLESYYKQRT